VAINQISIVCDSPGTYYYGSGKYRGSAKCQAGDKARLSVELQVEYDIEATAYLTLYVDGYGTVASVPLISSEEMCSSSLLKTYNKTVLCENEKLEAGRYYIKTSFYWGSQDDTYVYSFTPKVVVGITSNPKKNQYDLGGANTDKCAGKTLRKWSAGARRSAANTLRTFLLTFGILTGSLFTLLLAGWCIMRANDRKAPKQSMEEELLDEEDPHKIAMVGKNNDLVDF
jgi:hypothetical protein